MWPCGIPNGGALPDAGFEWDSVVNSGAAALAPVGVRDDGSQEE